MHIWIMYGLAFISVVIVVWMLLKKMDIKMTLLSVGMVLVFFSLLLDGAPNAMLDWFAPFTLIVDQFKSVLPRAGLIILILGGYTTYMSKIGANEVSVHMLTKPLLRIKSVYMLVPIVFLLGNFLSLVIPSAANLAVILLATLYPVLRRVGMSSLTAAGVIATTATIMPTPLGGDNVAMAMELGMPVTEYVFHHHAMISIPTLLVVAVAHYVWQRYMDKKEGISQANLAQEVVDVSEELSYGRLFRIVYSVLPMLPILLLLLFYAMNLRLPQEQQVMPSVEVVSILSFFLALLIQAVRYRNLAMVLEESEAFFKGMGNAMGIVALLVAAGVFVEGLKSIGLMQHLEQVMRSTAVPGFTLPLILVLFSALIVLLSGSGLALFYAMVPLVIPLSLAAGINPLAISIPVGFTGNLLRAVSPVAAVVVIVAGTTQQDPLKIVRRTAVPMVVGVVFMFILSMMRFTV
ncbi:C4-dicarboxylate transporter DcuC [Spirochaetales bacterium BR151]|uniref:C4-dicarboxylate transporter DcuC n=2 Tax=Entomospira culicis TaxID=2719989 RepID=A0A968GG35_9SPIO|nr:C4-dicarboxylate transporter DcuC [Entomospira culicis]NIZ69858.1 C4-dicarboxylate transporter DcuC [Entomospira culicis]